MTSTTKIEWTDQVWNPVTGCTRVSPGCAHCYAERMAKRLRGRFGYPADDSFEVTLHPDRLTEPLKRKKPTMYFVCSMGDLFHKDVPSGFLVAVFEAINNCPQHIFMVLTKRIVHAMQYSIMHKLPDNLWLGTSTENQKTADERITSLIRSRAAIRFLSCEPLLGPVDLGLYISELDWVIVGGESGPGARPMHPDWARSLRDQCKEANVLFFFKQWGGVHKNKAGRLLDDVEHNAMPTTGE